MTDMKFNYSSEYANAGQDDLWRSMTKQARTDGVLPTDIDVKTIMDTWTLQMGFPMITVTRNYETGLLHFQQVRYIFFGSISIKWIDWLKLLLRLQLVINYGLS